VRWKEEIQSYLRLRLQIRPTPSSEFKTGEGVLQKQVGLDPQVHGWAVCVWIRDRNKAGQWQDTFPMTVFLRNEKIVHVNNPPDGYGPAGRSTRGCKTLGAPFKDK
jgi:hypothetical protein